MTSFTREEPPYLLGERQGRHILGGWRPNLEADKTANALGHRWAWAAQANGNYE
jgi:hypothetical protein